MITTKTITTRTCDRCGTEVESFKLSLYRWRPTYRDEDSYIREADLCDSCTVDFNLFMDRVTA